MVTKFQSISIWTCFELAKAKRGWGYEEKEAKVKRGIQYMKDNLQQQEEIVAFIFHMTVVPTNCGKYVSHDET